MTDQKLPSRVEGAVGVIFLNRREVCSAFNDEVLLESTRVPRNPWHSFDSDFVGSGRFLGTHAHRDRAARQFHEPDIVRQMTVVPEIADCLEVFSLRGEAMGANDDPDRLRLDATH